MLENIEIVETTKEDFINAVNNANLLCNLTVERYNQLALVCESLEEIVNLIKEWGIDNVNNGYGIFDYDCLGLLCIEAIGDIMAFNTDYEAVKKAILDDIKIIPVEQLPINMPKDMRFFGWLDTEENRKNIAKFCYKLLDK